MRKPRKRFETAVALDAQSSSKPHNMDSSAVVFSATVMLCRVWGMVRAVSAMMKASRASVLASPGCRSATLRMVRPGRYAMCIPMS